MPLTFHGLIQQGNCNSTAVLRFLNVSLDNGSEARKPLRGEADLIVVSHVGVFYVPMYIYEYPIELINMYSIEANASASDINTLIHISADYGYTR